MTNQMKARRPASNQEAMPLRHKDNTVLYPSKVAMASNRADMASNRVDMASNRVDMASLLQAIQDPVSKVAMARKVVMVSSNREDMLSSKVVMVSNRGTMEDLNKANPHRAAIRPSKAEATALLPLHGIDDYGLLVAPMMPRFRDSSTRQLQCYPFKGMKLDWSLH
jgi:hypothetical protein